MDLLLDSHALIWFITLDKQLPSKTKSLIENMDNRCSVSVASLWEIAIKYSLGKLDLKIKPNELFKIVEQSGFEILNVNTKHALTVASLPFHHRDPFDRMLVSQGMVENLSIVTKDTIIKEYDVKTIW